MIDLPTDFIEDLRNPIPGDSFTWYELEPAAAKKALVIHHSASPTDQDGFNIAQAHLNKGWGGIGYHFVVRHDTHPKGAGVEYVGDLGTKRAHVEGQNQQKVGICLVGNFVNDVPGRRQLELTRKLIDFLISPNNILPSISYYSQVTYHNAVPGYSGGTACPGWTNPNFEAWLNYLKGGAFPLHFYESTPVVEDARPEWEKTYVDNPSKRVTTVEAYATDMTASGAPVQVKPGSEIDVAGYFSSNGKEYARTTYSKNNNKWYGLPTEAFSSVQPTGQPSGEVPVTVAEPVPVETPAVEVPVIVVPPKPSFNFLLLIVRLVGKIFNQRFK